MLRLHDTCAWREITGLNGFFRWSKWCTATRGRCFSFLRAEKGLKYKNVHASSSFLLSVITLCKLYTHHQGAEFYASPYSDFKDLRH